MRIGALADRSGVSTRMLRHYEQQGLLRPARAANGYREYEQKDVVRAQLVSSLIRSGLPTRLIATMLDEDDTDGGSEARRTPGDHAAAFGAELERLERRLACLTLSRDSVRRYLQHGPSSLLQLGSAEIPALAPSAEKDTGTQR